MSYWVTTILSGDSLSMRRPTCSVIFCLLIWVIMTVFVVSAGELQYINRLAYPNMKVEFEWLLTC